jgi:hypothetical protein
MTSNEKELKSKLNIFQRKHLPKATSEALNIIAVNVVNAERAQLQKKLDRPKPFSIRAINYFKAKPNDLSALIYIKKIAAEYLQYPLTGDDEQTGKRKLVPVVGDKKLLDKYGNIKGLRQKSTQNKTGRFMTKNYLFESTTNGKRLLAVWKQTIKHKKFMDFFKIAFGLIKNNYDKELDKQIRKAIRK